MKNTEMRLFFALIILFASLGDLSLAKKLSNHKKEGGKQINAVHDTAGPNASIQTAIRRTPTVTSYNNAAPLPRKPSTDMSFSNSNTNDASSANDYPKTAGIVNPSITFKGTNVMSAVKETPAHVGYTTRRKTVTSLNKETGKIEKHRVTSKEPLVGVVKEVKPLKVTTSRKYDLENHTFGPIKKNIEK